VEALNAHILTLHGLARVKAMGHPVTPATRALRERLLSLATGEGLKARLIRGGLGSAGIQAANRVLTLALGIVLARGLGAEGYRVYAYAFALMSLLMVAAEANTPHLTYANTQMPFSEHMATVHPLQFYAATKRANELMAHSYSHLFRLPTTGLRVFTVYGTWGRPDMALFQFTKNILEGKPIQVFNNGNHSRDFTYVDDIVEGVIRASDQIAAPNPAWNSASPDPATSNAPWRLFNIGNNSPINLSAYIEAIEVALGKSAIKELLPLQPGDVPDTFADVTALIEAVGYQPSTPVQEGVNHFVEWFKAYHA